MAEKSVELSKIIVRLSEGAEVDMMLNSEGKQPTLRV
jgi:hypothetical protein